MRRFTLSIFPSHKKEKKISCNCFIIWSGGFGRTVKHWTKIGNANVLMTVIFPHNDIFLRDQSFKSLLIWSILDMWLSLYLSSFNKQYWIPSILKEPEWFHIILGYVWSSIPQPLLAPIQIACVLSKLALSPEQVEYRFITCKDARFHLVNFRHLQVTVLSRQHIGL